MASKKNPFAFTPIILDQDTHVKRRVIQQLPEVHQTETLQKFFGATADHLFDPGNGKPINGYVGQKPLWYDPTQDYYLGENTSEREFYQLEAAMVSKDTEGNLTNLLPYPDLINQLRFQGGIVNNHNRLFSNAYYTWCPPIDLDKILNFRQYAWLPIDDVQPTSTFDDGSDGWVLSDGTPAPVKGPLAALGSFLGEFAGTPTGAQIVSKTFTLNSKISTCAISFDFLKMNSWDSVPGLSGVAPQLYGPECLSVYLNNELAFTFTPVDISGRGGSSIGSGSFDLGDLSGSYNVTSPGADSQLDADDTSNPLANSFTDRVYHITMTVNGTVDTLKLGFGSNTDESLANESMGIDNVTVNQASATAIVINGPSYSVVADGKATTYPLPGYGNTDADLAKWYDVTLASPTSMLVLVDGVSRSFTVDIASKTLTISPVPAADAVVQISAYSDLQNNAVGLPTADPKAFGGIQLSSGMRVSVPLDRDYDFTKGIYIVENVGRSIQLIKEVNTGVGLTPDYMVMGRGAINGNEWSTKNRWFHVNTLSDTLDPDYVSSRRATRPIIEFDRDLELYQYGLSRRLDVDMIVENVEDMDALLNANPTSITLNGVAIQIISTGIRVTAINPKTNTIYGDVESIRLLIRNTVNDLLNNNVFVLINENGVFKLVLEVDGQDPSGAPVVGEVVNVLLGGYAGKNVYWDGGNWSNSQYKAGVNQAPLFELYDLNGTSLRDATLYPNSTFQGSRLFNYGIDPSSYTANDTVLGIPLIYDTKGQIQFQNYLATDTYNYVVAGKPVTIGGFYFHKTGNPDADLEVLSNDWYAAPVASRQYMVDRFTASGRTKLFTASQFGIEVIITLGRVDDAGNFQETILTEDVDYIVVGRKIMIHDIKTGDIIEIKTYSNDSPPSDAQGYYEVPLNLQANPDNQEVSVLTKGDFYDQFSEIIKGQQGFTGAEYSANNYRDTPRDVTLGTHVIQHSAGLLKTMLLASQSNLDIMAAIRFVDNEYGRFKEKFHQRVLFYTKNDLLATATNYDTWINTVLTDLNKGKTKHFPFYLSGMAQTSANQLPTFIPATPSFLGVFPIYTPSLNQDGDNWYVQGHDGSVVQGANETCARVIFALEQRIHDSIPATIRNRERPLADYETAYADEFRSGDYTYAEWLQILQPAFERWVVHYHLDDTINDSYERGNPWSWNWSSQLDTQGNNVPGNWRGIYEKFYGTQRPHLAPWECLGFASKPAWWDTRYGGAPYTSDNLILWQDLEQGLIFEGDRQGTNPEWARPGLSNFIPVDPLGRLRHPGPRNLIAFTTAPQDPEFLGDEVSFSSPAAFEDAMQTFEYDPAANWAVWTTDTKYLNDTFVNYADQLYKSTQAHTSGDFDTDHMEGLWIAVDACLGIGIVQGIPLPTDGAAEWKFGDIGPVELSWRFSSNFSFAVAGASYLMKPAQFIELGWNSEDIALYFKGTPSAQFLSQDTKGRLSHSTLQIHGETLEDQTQIKKVGIQQWVSDNLASDNTDINANFANPVRGLGAQLAYKVAGFTDSTTLVAASDAFGRVPSEDISINVYKSPSIREESYSGVAVEWKGDGYEIYGYDVVDPYFNVIAGNPYGQKLGVGDSNASAPIPQWRPNTYYSVNLTLYYDGTGLFYRCVKSHTSSDRFDTTYWTQVARPQYANGTRLTWLLDDAVDAQPTQVMYGTKLKMPQDVADFLNGYERYLKSRGWLFSDDDGNGLAADWQTSLKYFIQWSSNASRAIGDFITLSPSNQLVQFQTDEGAIQPVEQIINGVYAIMDQNGQPVDPQVTNVVRSDGNITIACTDSTIGLYSVRLYVSEVEHVIVFNNQTIFGDTIYNPLLNIHQPRLRLQGFKTIAWQGRIDAPGFLVTGDTLTPNFERSADDFRRFFDIESMENKTLQDRARANFGYEEKDYLDNLLLSPTNQFEFYKGMIQQKGSPTAMRRLLRSNFIRQNKGLQLFEEWAFRVGDYGGQEVTPSLDILIRQSEYTHNPQLIEFSNSTANSVNGIINVVDTQNADGSVATFDARWYWRPNMNQIKWPLRDYSQEEHFAPSPGYVKLDEVAYMVPTLDAWSALYADQDAIDETINDGERVWVYGIGEVNSDGSPNLDAWSTHKFHFTGFNIIDSTVPSWTGQNSALILDRNVQNFTDRNSDPSTFYVNQAGMQENFIIKGMPTADFSTRGNFRPLYSNTMTYSYSQGGSRTDQLMTMLPQAGQFIKGITINVTEAFAAGSTITVGHENQDDYFVQLMSSVVVPRSIDPTNYSNSTGSNGGTESVLVQTPAQSFIPSTTQDTTAPVTLTRVGLTTSYCATTTVTYVWVPSTPGAAGTSGSYTLMRPSDYTTDQDPSLAYSYTVQVPVPAGLSAVQGTMTVTTNGVQTDSQTLTITKANAAGLNIADLTTVGTYSFTPQVLASFYPKDTNTVGGIYMDTTIVNAGATGKLTIEVDYWYGKGFELTQYIDGETQSAVSYVNGGAGQLYNWLNTRYPNQAAFSTIQGNTLLWNDGDIVEIDADANGRWFVQQRINGQWTTIRQQNRKVNSDLLDSASLFNVQDNERQLILQLYDPMKGFIPGIADRELNYKTLTDPATYSGRKNIWGKDNVGQLWWDLSAVRYLDYEILDGLSGYNYRWKNWGRVAPGATVNIYQWTRSTVLPENWNAYVQGLQNQNVDDVPTGTVDPTLDTPFVQATEWNDNTLSEETAYYFWVLNPTVTPTLPSRKLSAQQVSNIIANPSANDIPFFAAIGQDKIIVGGIKQFLTETDTVLKIKWNLDTDVLNNHHKQWIILREADERNTIDDPLWNKMRDSLVGYDATEAQVPDPRLPAPMQTGALVRPRQSWYPADVSPSGGQRPSRAARAAFVDNMNSILSAAPFVDQWVNWESVFATGEATPTSDQYVATALDLSDLALLLPAARQAVNEGECVLVENTTEAAGFWTLWRLAIINGQRTFVLQDFQKWRMQEGELWNLVDWYDTGWSAKNFPNYRFATNADRTAAGNLDVTLLNGTLVQIDNTDTDSRWIWDVYTSTTNYQVAKHNATIALSDAFYDDTRTELGPVQVAAVLGTPDDQRITPARIQELADLINYRDGAREIEYVLNQLRTTLFDVLQKNALFFSMVKTAFAQNKMVDWAFKTSFLYLGGYSETLLQSPVAFKDQIDNVISYLDEVMPYHTKIREYVRRLSYGPDTANLAMTDFDKPVYPAGSSNRVLDPTVAADQVIMAQNRPWKDWYTNYQKTNTNIDGWNDQWNPVRRMTISVLFDRISCGTVHGWDTYPWDPSQIVFTTNNTAQLESLSTLNSRYRNRKTAGGANPYGDQSVETIADRNYLVRKNIVTTANPGTIITVLADNSHWMWTGDQHSYPQADHSLDNTWIQFIAQGWDVDPDYGEASRIYNSYQPLPGMTRKDDPNIIDGCEFDGTVISSKFKYGGWDIFEWDSTGYAAEFDELGEQDIDSIDGGSLSGQASQDTDADNSDAQKNLPEAIQMDGAAFSQPGVEGGRPRELVVIKGIESLIINVQHSSGEVLKLTQNQKGKQEVIAPGNTGMAFVGWDQSSHIVSLNIANYAEDAQGFMPLHDPENPSTGFIRDVMLTKAYKAQTSSSMAAQGTMTFTLKDMAVPHEFQGTNIRVAIVNPKNQTVRALATVTNVSGYSFTVDVDGGANIGSAKTWHVIPVSMYHEPGVVWIGNARFTYTGVEAQGSNVYHLVNAKVSANTLSPLTLGSDAQGNTTFTLKDTSTVLDGSKVRTVVPHKNATPL